MYGYLFDDPEWRSYVHENPAWNLAIAKKRQDVGDVYANLPLLHLVLGAAWTLSIIRRIFSISLS